MINIKREKPSQEILDILVLEKQKESGTYRQEKVIQKVKQDFYNKCYLCEIKETTSLNIEHFIPHKGNKDLKFEWSNLFLSCYHCNNIKGHKYDNILNPVDEEEDVENLIKYRMEPFPKSKVEIVPLKTDDKIKKTCELLELIYNGSTALKSEEAHNLKKKLLDDLMDFQEQLYIYYYEEVFEDDVAAARKNIAKHLNKKSSFTAFKRWIIKDNPVFYDDFKEFID